jgi:hypothetical protein
MNLSNLDETTYDQALFTKTDIYRKMKNLMNTYDVYRLVTLDDIFVWSKVYHNDNNDNNDINITGIVVDFGDLLCVNDTKYLTIYRLYETMATDLMIFTGLNELVWNKLNIPIDINNIKTTSLLDIPSHIDLTQECDDDDDEVNDDADDADDEGDPFEPFGMNLEPLCGWANLLNEEVIDLPDFNYDYPVNDEQVKDEKVTKELIVEIPTRYRVDPYDGEWYSEDEFFEYYGGHTEWDNQHPKYVLRREQYCYFASMFDHLSDKRFMFLFKKYDRTFS